MVVVGFFLVRVPVTGGDGLADYAGDVAGDTACAAGVLDDRFLEGEDGEGDVQIEIATSADSPVKRGSSFSVNDTVDIFIFTGWWTIEIPAVNYLVMTVDRGDETAPIWLLKTRERP